MAGYDDCIAAIRAVDEKLTDEEIDALVTDLQRRQKVLMATGEAASQHEAAMLAADQIGKEHELAAALVKRQEAENFIKYNEIKKNLDTNWKDNPWDGIRAWLMGSNKKGANARDSVKAAQIGLHNKYLAGLEADLIRGDLKDAWLHGGREMEIETAQVVRAMSGDEPLPAVSDEAKKLGKIIFKWQEIARLNSNKAGSFIGKLPDYMFTQSHDALRIRMNGGENGVAWKEYMKQGLDWERMGIDRTDTAEVDKFLNTEYNRILSGHFEQQGAGAPVGVPASLAKKVSAERVFHFKDAESAFNYNETFGKSNFREAVMNGLRRSSQNTALMQRMGTNPEYMLNRVMKDQADRLLREGKSDAVNELDANKAMFEDMLKNLDGRINAVGREGLAAVGASVRAVEGFKLGGMLISQLSDIGIYGAMARTSGQSMVGAMMDRIAGVFKGRRDLETRAFGASLGVFYDHFSNIMQAQHMPEGGTPGWLAKGSAIFMRLTGGPWWQDAARITAGLAKGHEFAVHAEAGFGDLPVKFRQHLETYGIDANMWEAMRSHGLVQGPDGRMYMQPEAMKNIPDNVIDGLIQDKINGINARVAEVRAKHEAAMTRENSWIESRVNKIQSALEKGMQIVEDIKARRGNAKEALTDRLMNKAGLVEAKVERAHLETELGKQLSANRTFEQQAALLNAVEKGKRSLGSALDQLEGAASRNAGENVNRGFTLGQKIAKAEQRIKELEAKQAAFDKETGRQVSTKEAEVDKRLADRIAELDKFQSDIEARQATRQETVDWYENNIDRAINRARNAARENLDSKLFNLYADTISFMALEPDANTRRLINMGTIRGTWGGEAARSFWQFKGFTFAYIQKVLGTLLEADTMGEGLANLKKGRGDMAGLAGLIAASTAFGYMSMTMKDLVKGKEPRDITEHPGKVLLAAMAQGGGLGLYGDFLFGEANRYGGGVTQTLMGPTFGDAIQLGQMTNELIHGDSRAADWVRFAVSHVPNLWYTKMAFDYLVSYRIYEALNPGYLARMEQRMQRENGQGFYLSPSSAIQ